MSSGDTAEFVDYYALLGVRPTAEIPHIRKAYILKAKQHHPDAGGSTEMMKLLNRAYKTLTSSSAKAAYDMLHSIEVGTTRASDYRYGGGREVTGVEDMTDEEVDDFLDSLLAEHRTASGNKKTGVWQRIERWYKNSR